MKKQATLLTDKLFFDTDCLSAFLWVNDQSLLKLLYPGRIVIPRQVYDELSNPRVPHLKTRVDKMTADHTAVLADIETGKEEYDLYYKLTVDPDPGHVIIGSGEAAAIALAFVSKGILASNNLKDISHYVRELGLRFIATADILGEALEKGLISEDEGEKLWQEMLSKRRRLGYASFHEYLEKQR